MTPHPQSRSRGVIVALDTPSAKDALIWADRLLPYTPYMKVGLELFSAEGPKIVEQLNQKGARVFLDLKLYDIPNTVKRACEAIAKMGVFMCTVHASGGASMIEAARAGFDYAPTRPILLAVTVLTSMPQTAHTETEVLALARLAQSHGADGVVASAHEAVGIRAQAGPAFTLVTPGIRLLGQDTGDQSRVMTPELAFAQGADFIVMGRGILESKTPETDLQAALSCLCSS